MTKSLKAVTENKQTMLDSVHSPIGDLDDFVQCDKRRLQWRQLNKQLDSALVVFLQFGQLLTSTG